MAKRGRPPKHTQSHPLIVWLKKQWKWLLAFGGLLVGFIAFLDGLTGSINNTLQIGDRFFSKSVVLDENNKWDCHFPKKFQKDTLYILVTRFESYISTVETECYGRSLQARIDLIANQRKLPVRVCYNQNIAINTIDEAKRVQRENNADVVFYGTIRNIEKSCMAGDVCFKNQISDTLIHLTGGKVKKEELKYEKGLSPQQIEMGDFHINEKRFDTWIFTYYNAKIGKFNPNLYVIEGFLSPNEKAKAHLEKAKLFCNLDKYNKTILDCNISIDLSNNNYEAYVFRGFAKEGLKDYQGAIIDYSKAIELSPKNALLYIYRGNAKLAIKDYQGAILDCSKVNELDSRKNLAYTLTGDVKYELQNYQGAIADYSKAIGLDSNYARAYNNRGVSKDKLQDYKGAIKDYSKAIRLDSNFAKSYNNRAISKKAIKDYKGAISDYSNAIKLDSNYVIAYNNSGNLKLEMEDYQGAIVDYSQVIEREPKYPFIFNSRGDAKFEKKDYQGAIIDYSKAIEFDSKTAENYYDRGTTNFVLKNFQSAIIDFTKAIELDSKEGGIYQSRGNVKYELKDYQSAIIDYSKAIELNPNNAVAYHNRGVVKDKLGLNYEAENDFKKAEELGYDYSNSLIMNIIWGLIGGGVVAIFLYRKIFINYFKKSFNKYQ
jgi:tetratricopeptide (TPR) repeat protein